MLVLIVKHGALGDVVRTSYFARSLKEYQGDKLQIIWITSPEAKPLLIHNPYIDRIVTTFKELGSEHFDRIFSLDDELEVLQEVKMLEAEAITGAFLQQDIPTYSEDSAVWFDMGLLSRFGKERADLKKKENLRSHADIFREIFGVPSVKPCFYGEPHESQYAKKWYSDEYFTIAVNPFAGGRWPSKELPDNELKQLINGLLDWNAPANKPVRIFLLGAGADRIRNENLLKEIASDRVHVQNTDESILRLAAIIDICDLMISSDSLALHLGIAQSVPFVAFFSPTSAAEIDDFGMGRKVKSTSNDYCSYRRDADNKTITASRLIEECGILCSTWFARTD